MKMKYLGMLLVVLLLMCTQEREVEPTPGDLTIADMRLPENALVGLEVTDGLVAQVFAHEPMVRNPSNMDIDHLGRVWLVENVNYRPENNPDNPYQDGGDMIVILEDTTGNGKADVRKVFFQDLLVDGAMGIGVFDNRVYLSTSPHILVLTDHDRDDQADEVDTLFTGMGHKQGDHTVHAVSFGPDGRIYFNYGNSAKRMLHKDGSPVVDKMGNEVNGSGNPYRQGMVFRCELDGSNLESLGHNFRNNYEVCVDSYGRMWQSDNDDDGNKSVRINYVMEYGNYGYRDEMTGAAWQTGRTGSHAEISKRHWHQNDPGVIPNLYITGSGSPCGILYYEGTLLPAIFQRQIIHADAGPGAVWAFPATASGAGFTAVHKPLLMRKLDAWYRPTDVSVAPDGSLLATDWYDPGVGGHWAGDPHRGRVFRITVPGQTSYRTLPLDLKHPRGAVSALQSPNAATRFMAWQALDEFGPTAESELLDLWEGSRSEWRARALWLLGRISIKHILNALSDPDVLLRATAIRVVRQLYPEKLSRILRSVVNDPAAQVRREAAVALRELDDHEMPDIWSDLAKTHDGSDRWYLEALGIGAENRWDECLDAYLASVQDWNTASGRDIIWRSRSSKTLHYLVQLLSNPKIPLSEAARYLRATDFQDGPGKNQQLEKLLKISRPDADEFYQIVFTHLSPDFAMKSAVVKTTMSGILPKIRGSEKYLDIVAKLRLQAEAPYLYDVVVKNPTSELGFRAANILIQLEGWDRFEKGVKTTDQNSIIQILGAINKSESKSILKNVVLDATQPVSIRKLSVDALAKDWGWEKRMTELLQHDQLESDITSLVASKLVNAARQVDRNKGIEYLQNLPGASIPGLEEIPSLDKLLMQSGDIAKGEQVFEMHCINCHQVNGKGIEFGPDLSEIGNKLGRDGLFSAILYPSAAISHGFEGVHFELRDGSHHSGYILQEDEESIAIRLANGSTQKIMQSEVVKRELLEQSLMTPGLGQVIGEEGLVDLVAYLSNLINHETLAENPFQGKLFFERDQEK